MRFNSSAQLSTMLIFVSADVSSMFLTMPRLMPLQRQQLALPTTGLDGGSDEVQESAGSQPEPFVLPWLQAPSPCFLTRHLDRRHVAYPKRRAGQKPAENGPIARGAEQI